MSDAKTYVFGQDSNCMNWLAPLLQQKGIDPNVLAIMNNGGFGGNGNWIWVLFLILLFGRNGFGGYGDNVAGTGYLSNQITNTAGRDLLMQAITGNGNAVQNLANNLNCDINSVKSAINGIMSHILGVGNQVGMSSQLIINAIQAGNCQIASKLADCCCENRLAICQQTNTLQNAINGIATGQERGFLSVAYETQKLTCDILNSIKSATDAILAGQRNAEMREMLNKIDALREANSLKDVVINNGQQTAIFSSMMQSATAPITNAVNALQGDINGIKCRLPETVTLPYSCATAVPTQAVFGYNGLGWTGFGLNGCGCNNSLWG